MVVKKCIKVTGAMEHGNAPPMTTVLRSAVAMDMVIILPLGAHTTTTCAWWGKATVMGLKILLQVAVTV